MISMKYKFPICGLLLCWPVLLSPPRSLLTRPPFFTAAAPRRLRPRAAAKPVVRVNGTVLTDADLLREEYAIFPVRPPAQRDSQGAGAGHSRRRPEDDRL